MNVTPTYTYPNHTTLVTGVWPAEHGIYNNTPFDPTGEELGRWNWYASLVKVPTIWQAAHEDFSAGRARDRDCFGAKAQAGEVNDVLAEKVIAHVHVGEAPPCQRVGCGLNRNGHLALPPLLWPLHVRVKRGMYMPNASWRRRG
jgi:hypothetical protein